jgi:hypothetical protein
VPRTGLWLFFAAAPDQDAAAATAFAQLRGVQVQRPAPRFFAVRSAAKLPPRRLIELGIRIRKSWQAAVPANARVAELLIADRQVLAAPSACPSYGDLGDPDITPHWPPVHGPQ